MAPSRRSGPSNNKENPDIATIIAQQLQNILPQIVTQVTNNVNNANGGNVQARGHKAAIGMSWTDFKALLVEEFCPRNEMEKLESEFWNHKMVRANHAGYIDWFHELAKLVPHLVTPESSRIMRYIAGLAPEIRGMLRANQTTTIQSEILRAGILTDEAVSCGTLTKGNEKRKGVKETSKQGGWRNDDKRAKVSKGFMVTTPHGNGYTGPHSKCAKCWTHHPEGGPCLVCFNCQKSGHFARNYRMSIKQVAPINDVRGNHKSGTCYECGSREHYQNNCSKFTRAPGQMGNRLHIFKSYKTRVSYDQVILRGEHLCCLLRRRMLHYACVLIIGS
ncbi:reverse transcriptase domain-containing protein [Tanacetum coccineum]